MFKDFKIAYIEKNVHITKVKPMNFLRESVAYMLTQSANTIPHAAMMSQCDITPLIEYAKQSEKTIKPREGETPEQFRLRRAVRKNYSAFFLKAIAHTVNAFPDLPVFLHYRVWRGPGKLYYSDDINLSYTANTKFGVVKPIIRNAHKKTVVQVAEEMRELTRKARRTDINELYRRVAIEYVKYALKEFNFREIKGIWMLTRALLRRDPVDPEFADVPEEEKLKPSDILGATVTIANNGMVVQGNQTQTIITPPEMYMMGISDLHQTPLVVDGQIVPRWTVTIFTTMDHRALDAGEGFPFFYKMREYFNKPELIYEWEPEK
jgi:pyruvate/2-oxoglutarate dehydrogenase complex dihydrolipoamide acyltransferase (E2) component